jgi:hypothetical protein
MQRLIILLVLLLFLLPSSLVSAQDSVQVTDVNISYTYGDRMEFSAFIRSKSPIESINLLFQVEGEEKLHSFQLNITSSGKSDFVYEMRDGLIKPFANVIFWYHILLSQNNVYDSPSFSFQYIDNNYSWQSLQNSNLRVHWILGSTTFGQEALEAAIAGYKAVKVLFPNIGISPVDIYIYPTTEDIQGTLNKGGYTWVGGHVNPDLDVVLVSIAPGENETVEMEHILPHELAHLLLYRMTGNAYANLPVWLNEGIASVAEAEQNSNYPAAVETAGIDGTQIPLPDLCVAFPSESERITLAYAESDSFVRFLVQNYGAFGLQGLVDSYSSGMNCEDGSKRALGYSLTQLYQSWQMTSPEHTLRENPYSQFLPYLFLLAVVLALPALGLIRRGRKEPVGHIHT